MNSIVLLVGIVVTAQLGALIVAASIRTFISLVNKRHGSDKIFNRKMLSEVLYYWLLRPLVHIPIIVILISILDFVGLTEGRVLTSAPIILQIIILYLLFEFFAYWAHRIFHGSHLLYRFHEPHHNIKSFEWSRGRLDHFVVEILLLMLFVFAGLLLGVLPITFIITIVIWETLLALAHHNCAFSYGVLEKVFVYPHTHKAHHFDFSYNSSKDFGLTSNLYDYIFRTNSK